MDDRVSQWLLTNWYKPNYNHPNMLVACTLARQLNNTESLAAIGFPKHWEPKRVEKILNARAVKRLKNFSSAYMITGTLGGTKVEQIVHKVVDPLFKKPPKIDTYSMQRSVEALLPYAGFSHFIAGQVVADMRWAVEGTWADKHDWAAIGPGSRRGMNIVQGRGENYPLKPEQFTVELKALINTCQKRLPKSITNRLEAIDYQNCCCEQSGYEKVLWGRGRKKQLYRPYEELSHA